ncbi:hypothetical protein AJ79_09820 [Neofusicoccum parvum]|uniref:Uncharacterized protein n=1 Tax=Neofusicoccum parvum TaxID=310453 RepID=A0ACB5SA98_9PEZI|nr:hypothetical protein AJ79_09820 [Neofusicoccum parvum]GME64952.1 hypothetical protein AJ79_09820 [Neofusicoccum parvum]
MSSLPSPPFVAVDGVSNFRSIGGLPLEHPPSAPKRSTRHSLIFRSADPYRLTPAGSATLRSLDIATVFDLRSQPELSRQPPAIDALAAAGARLRATPIFPHEDWSPEAIASRHGDYAASATTAGYVRAYARILEHAGTALREMLLHVRDHRPGTALLCHCSAGKDRTGVVVAVLLKLAGCSDRVVAREYELTELGLAGRRQFIIDYLLAKPEIGGDRTKAERVAGAR